MQSVMSATDTPGHRDVCMYIVQGLSATDPHLRWWISIRTMPKDVGMPLFFLLVLVTAPHMSLRRDNTTPISKNGIA